MILLSALVDLRDESTWEPSRLTTATFAWPSNFPRVAVSDVVGTLMPSGIVPEGTQVITPRDLNAVAGGVSSRSRNYQGPVYQVGGGDDGLLPGDVLVPPAADTPALLINGDFIGSAFSARFIALRPAAGHELWLWAVLSSQSGRVARSHVAAGAALATVDLASLMELRVPWPPLVKLRQIADELALLERDTHGRETEAAESWWGITDLRKFGWQEALAMPDPVANRDGLPLINYCDAIRKGRHIPSDALVGYSLEKALPITDISVLSGKPVKRWVPPDVGLPLTLAEPGDLLLASLGSHPYATVTNVRSVVHQNVFVLRLKDTSLAPALARYLNGQAGYGLRQVLSTGSGIQHLSKRSLENFPVANDDLNKAERQPSYLPLATQLEQLLWS